MDVIVEGKDGTKNCVNTDDIKPIEKEKRNRVGSKIKMFYKKKWYTEREF